MNITVRFTRDVEVRTTSQQKEVANFSVAIKESYATNRFNKYFIL
ncbi:hypothetical protein QWY99_15415 [Flavobacterium branchiarum]|uniref:Uncharacterized protein n=1 Tax=Flavobacterium branchiarum TaxID=1114870 RepID=A0ABV5FLF7_9FLAO|nr:hypothetical protein [Flavobacterium branchiarum]MDN3674432.1 hypothetical protein [Flavobacterium branchiarum]